MSLSVGSITIRLFTDHFTELLKEIVHAVTMLAGAFG
jgi:hypothetical protein